MLRRMNHSPCLFKKIKGGAYSLGIRTPLPAIARFRVLYMVQKSIANTISSMRIVEDQFFSHCPSVFLATSPSMIVINIYYGIQRIFTVIYWV